MRRAPHPTRHAPLMAVRLYFNIVILCLMRRAPLMRRAHSLYIAFCAGDFWRPSRCPNWVQDSSLERYWSLISNTNRVFQFGVHFTYRKSSLPRLVKMCQMRLPQGRVLLQSTFEGVSQLQNELMIAHWKAHCV